MLRVEEEDGGPRKEIWTLFRTFHIELELGACESSTRILVHLQLFLASLILFLAEGGSHKGAVAPLSVLKELGRKRTLGLHERKVLTGGVVGGCDLTDTSKQEKRRKIRADACLVCPAYKSCLVTLQQGLYECSGSTSYCFFFMPNTVHANLTTIVDTPHLHALLYVICVRIRPRTAAPGTKRALRMPPTTLGGDGSPPVIVCFPSSRRRLLAGEACRACSLCSVFTSDGALTICFSLGGLATAAVVSLTTEPTMLMVTTKATLAVITPSATPTTENAVSVQLATVAVMPPPTRSSKPRSRSPLYPPL